MYKIIANGLFSYKVKLFYVLININQFSLSLFSWFFAVDDHLP